MSSSHKKIIHAALVGSPNCGKTTLYNWLTGSQAKTVNYPGATVEFSMGALAPHLKVPEHVTLNFMDTPGTYSLFPKSADEAVTIKALYEHPDFQQPEVVLAIVDGTQLSRHLILADQIKQTGFPMILVVTMSDLLRAKNIPLQIDVLKKYFQCEVVLFDGLLGGGINELLEKIIIVGKKSQPLRIEQLQFQEQETKMKQIEQLAEEVLDKNITYKKQLKSIYDRTAKLDSILLHPFFGLFIFVFLMSALFGSLFWLSAPLMDLVDQGFSFLSEIVKNQMAESLFRDFLTDGVLAAFTAIFVFVPQIFILFLGVSLFESSGYLARAATLIDKPFSKIGLSGRSFVPLLSGYACAVPAMMATRNISSSRERLITNMVIPLLTCSARLPVYALLITFLMSDSSAWLAGVVMSGLYLLSLVVAAVAASVLDRILPKNEKSLFMMELPLYRRPLFSVIVRQSLKKTSSYIKKAGPIIFVISVILWGLSRFPDAHNPDDSLRMQNSYLSQMGQQMQPVFTPMGSDWRVGVGLISAFAAREVFVSSMAVVFNVTDIDEETQTKSLLRSFSESVHPVTGKKLFSFPSIAALIMFFMIAMQCMTTFAVSIKENNSVKIAVFQLIGLNVLAYVMAVSVYQVLSLVF